MEEHRSGTSKTAPHGTFFSLEAGGASPGSHRLEKAERLPGQPVYAEEKWYDPIEFTPDCEIDF
jgi:hypothetical protein